MRVESEAAKKKKERTWAKIDHKWYHKMYNALGGKARELADDTEESGQALEAKLNDYYDKTTNAHAAYNLKKWVKTERSSGVPIEKHSAAWLAEMKEIEGRRVAYGMCIERYASALPWSAAFCHHPTAAVSSFSRPPRPS